MCGIAGIIDLVGARDIDMRALKQMTDALAHRGPDGEGFFAEPGVALGHRRLAIIDIAGGVQPFEAMDGGGVLITNGEIYNYRDLKRRLEDDRLRFRTASDTEVMAEGLNLHGRDFIERLRGMYAFAFWSRRERTLLLGRDRLGERPLYYARTPDGFFLFASEIGAIRASGLAPIRRRLDALSDYFLFGYVPDPKSVYEGVFKLPPASTLTVVKDAEPALRRYWRPEFNVEANISFETAKSALVGLIDDSVVAQMVADVPLGAFLSGGVDSSTIVAAMAASGATPTTCTIGFDNAAHDERAFAREIADRYRTRHHEDVVSVDAAGLIDTIAGVYGEPFADASALPTYEVSRAARNHVKVALSGDGGDEVFGGYRRYPFFAREECVRGLAPLPLRRATFGAAGALYPKLDWAPRPLRLKTTLQALGEDSISAYARSVSAILPDRLSRMLSAEFMDATKDYDRLSPVREAAGPEALDPISLAQKIDIATWLPGRMLTKVDRAALAHGLEVRAPMLDHRLVEWALALPPQFRCAGGVGKRILKSAMEERIGGAILHRRKQGFSPPVAEWLRLDGGPVDRLRQSEAWKRSGCLNAEAIARMITDHTRQISDYSQELWSVIMFDAFLRREPL
jgi:asparagine synthase (glutamine-hydrolysing)